MYDVGRARRVCQSFLRAAARLPRRRLAGTNLVYCGAQANRIDGRRRGVPSAGLAAPALEDWQDQIMPLGFLLLVIGFPLLELALLIKLGQVWGVGPVIALVIGTALLGALVLRTQGLAALGRVRDAVEKGRPTAGPLADGMLRAVAGALLIAPGVLTDIAGAALLVPPLRRWIAEHMLARAGEATTVTVEVRDGEIRASRFERPRGRRRCAGDRGVRAA